MTRGAYYNEIDPYAAQWLRNLIAAGHIAPGDVDERSIEDVHPDDVRGYTQCHWFAGIGVWSRALRIAGWADDRRVWTGSCPCQPFSAAGKGGGFDDERHLWPAWFHLIGQCAPHRIYGEQVASPNGLAWLDLVQADLENADYASGAVDFCSAGVGAPHIRQRLYWLADSDPAGFIEHAKRDSEALAERARASRRDNARGCGGPRGLADSAAERLDGRGSRRALSRPDALERLARRRETGDGALGGWWANAEWIPCRDGKWRPVEPGSFPLAHGATARVGRLRAYGNAINAQAAAVFIAATL